MNNADYHRSPGLNWSRLKAILTSPLHFQTQAPIVPTTAMMIGTRIHELVLTPELPSEILVWRGGSRTSKEGKAEWEALVGAGVRVTDVPHIGADDERHALRAADAVMSHPDARAIIEASERETVLGWAQDGVECRGRADLTGSAGLWDLKKSITADIRAFGRDAAAREYYCQLEWYAMGLAEPPDCVGFIVVEATAPYDVLVCEVDAPTRRAAQERALKALTLYRECEASGVWPGRHPKRVTLSAPAWWGHSGTDPTRDEAARLAAHYAAGDYDV